MASQQNMAMVLQALKNAGLNDNQARILGAEIGRENSFQDKYLWGYHPDPKNGASNIGIISWQGSRAKGVERALKEAGLIQNGKIVKGQQSLDVMAKYLVNEIRTTPAYAQTKKQFLDNPNVDYNTGTKVLGTNFILWRYDDPKYKDGHTNRDKFYRQLGGVTPAGGSATDGTTSAQSTTPTESVLPAYQAEQPQFQVQPLQQIPQTPDVFGMAGNSGLMGLNFDLLTALNGMSQQNATPLLPTPFS